MSYRVEVVGASRIARRFRQVARDLPRDEVELKREVGEDAELIFAAHAPARTGRLARGMSSLQVGDEIHVRADARNPETGFDYVAVTRFGHRKRVIRPRRDRAAATTIASRRGRQRGHRAALRFVINGQVLYRRSVKGYRPAGDWAQKATPEITQTARARVRRLGRDLTVRLGDT